MRTLSLLALLLAPSFAHAKSKHSCACYCYFRAKNGTLRREQVWGRGATLPLAWGRMERRCQKLHEGGGVPELQKLNPQFSAISNPGAQEWFPGTRENSCR